MEDYVQSVPATQYLQAAPPFQLVVYQLLPPPPGFLYAFTCGPTSFCMHAPAIAFSAEPLLPFTPFPPPHPPLEEQRTCIASMLPSTSDSFHSTCFASIPPGASCSNSTAKATDLASNCVAFTNVPQPDALTDRSLASLPAPLTAPAASPNQVELPSAANTTFLNHQLDHCCSSDAAEPVACSPFWSTKGRGFPRLQYPIEIEKSTEQAEQNMTSTSTCQTSMTLDEVIQQNKRFNKTPSFRVKKFVRTNSQISSVPETTKKDILPESTGSSSCYRSPANKLVQYSRPPASKAQHRITEYWRVREKPKEFQGHESTPDMKCSNAGEIYNANIGELNKQMRSFSFGLNSRESSAGDVRSRW